jgi:filamentous hemagglutinin family protein
MKILIYHNKKRFNPLKGGILSIFVLTLSQNILNSSCLPANAQIVTDKNLGNGENSIFDPNTNIIDGGAQRDGNLFHSFQDFNILKDQSVYFRNPQGITNIITRVTGGFLSSIDGKIGVLGGANLFILNPNGIIFGSNASLSIEGSFLSTTANSIQFGTQGFFDTKSQNYLPLLTVNPSGFLFTEQRIYPIANSSIYNNRITRISSDPTATTSTIPLNGLRVPDGNSLILLGGEITLDGGGLNALGGQIDLGSVSGNGLVSLSYDGKKLGLTFPKDLARDNIFLLNGARVDSSEGEFSGGRIQIIGKNIQLKDESRVVSETKGAQDGGALFFDAQDSIELVGFTESGSFSTLTSGLGKAGNIEITSGKLILRNGAQILSGTVGTGNGGNINVNVSDFLELSGRASAISSTTFASGKGGNIKIDTPGNLFLNSGAFLVAGGGSLDLNGTIVPSSGDGGSVDLVIGNSILIESGSALSASNTIGKGGDIYIDTNFLTLRNRGRISVNSSRGKSGNLTINSNSLFLDGASLSANTKVSGANISLTISNELRLENESRITATASGSADGGNITINTPILLAFPPTGLEGSDIKATAISGTGGKITVNAQGVFGIAPRKANSGNRTNDIDASSQFGQSGQVQINTTTDPSQGLVELPATVVDPSTLVAQNPCRRASSSEFTRSGRGGLPPSLSQDLNGESTQVGLVEPTNLSAATPEPKSASKEASPLPLSSTQIVPAQGWVYNAKGEVVLVAYNSAVTGPQRLQSTPAGCPVF